MEPMTAPAIWLPFKLLEVGDEGDCVDVGDRLDLLVVVVTMVLSPSPVDELGWEVKEFPSEDVVAEEDKVLTTWLEPVMAPLM